MNENTIRFKDITVLELKKILNLTIQTNSFNHSFHLFGDSGIGKTSVSRKFFQENNVPFLDLQVSLISKKELKETLYNFFKNIEENKFYGLILNELNHLKEDMMAAIFELIDSKKLDEIQLPTNVIIIATSNHIQDNAINKKLLAPLSNRFTTFHLYQSINDFEEYAKENSYHKSIISFLKLNPEYIMSKKHYYYNDVNFPSPRNWYKINSLISNLNEIPEEEHDFIKKLFFSILGNIVGNIYFEFLENRKISYEIAKNNDLYFDETKNIKEYELYDFKDVILPSSKKLEDMKLVEEIILKDNRNFKSIIKKLFFK